MAKSVMNGEVPKNLFPREVWNLIARDLSYLDQPSVYSLCLVNLDLLEIARVWLWRAPLVHGFRQANLFLRGLMLNRANSLKDSRLSVDCSDYVKDFTRTESNPEEWLKQVAMITRKIEELPLNYWLQIPDPSIISLQKSTLTSILIHSNNKERIHQLATDLIKIDPLDQPLTRHNHKKYHTFKQDDNGSDSQYVDSLLTGLLPSDTLLSKLFCHLPNLKRLSFHDFACTSSPDTLISLIVYYVPNLSHVALYGSGRMQFSSVVDVWQKCEKLREFAVFGIAIEKCNVAFIKRPRLHVLRIEKCNVELETLLLMLDATPLLEILELDQTTIPTTLISEVFGKCPSTLRGFCHITKSKDRKNLDNLLPKDTPRLWRIRALKFDGCDAITDEVLDLISKECRNLRMLALGVSYRFSEAGIRSISKISTLQSLHLSTAQFTKRNEYHHLQSLGNLKHLSTFALLIYKNTCIVNESAANEFIRLFTEMKSLKTLILPKFLLSSNENFVYAIHRLRIRLVHLVDESDPSYCFEDSLYCEYFGNSTFNKL
ncbi:hypothetical protein HK098_006194 [Nowakowskiella sp. JEL0407]|nr:hypothetical protein HK098_006194 [Nowakowskiella sp. JEL0407]